MQFPKHLSMTISHNEHRSYYQTVEQYLNEEDNSMALITAADRAAMIEADSIWKLQWYPRTPVGSYCVYAATLERAVELTNSADLESIK